MRVQETRWVGAVQAVPVLGRARPAARGLSAWGEHGGGWYAVALVGALVDVRRRDLWWHVGRSAFAAHLAAVLLKRVVRRRRPDPAQVTVGVSTPSELSFPSAHVASTTAAALALRPVVGGPAAAVLVVTMAVSRVLLGVHFPSDVVAAIGTGGLVERLVRTSRGRQR